MKYSPAVFGLVLLAFLFSGQAAKAAFTGVGPLPIAKGGTGSTTKNFVDLTTAQDVGGVKEFTSRTRYNNSAYTSEAQFEFGTAVSTGTLTGKSDQGSFLNYGTYLTSSNTWMALQTGTSSIVLPDGNNSQSFRITNGTTPGSTYSSGIRGYLTGTGFGTYTAVPTARLFVRAGSATAGTGPVKFASGTLLTTPEQGAFEFSTSHLYFTPASAREKIYTGLALVTSSQNPNTIANGAVWESAGITVSNAQVGDPVSVGPPGTLEAGLLAVAYVSATNTVKLRVLNKSGSSIDPASASWKFTVRH
jgi:hypothetical protein